MIDSVETIKKHLAVLRRRDKRFSDAIKTVGMPGPRMLTPGFGTLIRIIIDQQVSTAAGAAIWAKLRRAVGGKVTPQKVVALGEGGLRMCGLSGQKVRYALGVAEAAAVRSLNFAT